MRRTAHLRPLSREHHAALRLASHLGQANSPEALETAVAEAFALKPELLAHFRFEETELIPELERFGEGALVAQLRADHEVLIDFLASAPRMKRHAASFAQLLNEHVRFEERVLFPALEAHWDRNGLPPAWPQHAAGKDQDADMGAEDGR
ncbi:hemerythrin domain-containing protein [Niveibacterium sp.]|uniref:hemerythrin domain-containing protein n=1 Tax=Niveibacterium sp. TaxID=2017444 RepID=UPI0035AE0A4E